MELNSAAYYSGINGICTLSAARRPRAAPGRGPRYDFIGPLAHILKQNSGHSCADPVPSRGADGPHDGCDCRGQETTLGMRLQGVAQPGWVQAKRTTWFAFILIIDYGVLLSILSSKLLTNAAEELAGTWSLIPAIMSMRIGWAADQCFLFPAFPTSVYVCGGVCVA